MHRFASPSSLVRVGLFAALALVTPAMAAAQGSTTAPDSVRAALTRYRDPMLAVHDGYLSTVACVEFPEGAMGVHFIMPHHLKHYDLHVWLFKDNPRGMFGAINPNVKCTGYPFRVMAELETTVRHR